MARKFRNSVAIAAIAVYCGFAILFASLPLARDLALVILGLVEISISVAYLSLNRTLARSELRREVIASAIILVAIAFVGLQYLVR